MLTLDKVYHAAFTLKNVVRKTDLIVAPALSKKNKIYLKTENLQTTGSFKIRGAYYKISGLSEEEKSKGIIACSAGNHAQGVALASEKSNIPCIICMPDGAPISKVEATKSYGAQVCLVSDTYDDAYNKAIELQKEEGYTFIHPFNDEDVIAGQGTIGLEILEQLENVDAIVVPIGGGGLISGIAYVIKKLRPECKVYGVQASGAPSMYEAVRTGERKAIKAVTTFADGIAVKEPGDLTYEIVQEYVDEVITVGEDEIAAAILTLMEKQKLIAEGAGAVAVAAAMFDKIPVEGKNVVCIVSGGNIDVNILNRVIDRGLVMNGRKVSLTIALTDKPGQLVAVSSIISKCGANVVEVQYDNGDLNMPINSCFIRLTMETKDKAQIKEIKKELTKNGFTVVKERV